MNGLPLRAYARLWLCALLLRPLKHVVAFDTLVRWARRPPRAVRDVDLEHALEAFMVGGGRFPRRAPGNCLERSLGVYRLLCESGANPEVVVGLRKRGAAGIEGHVWIAVDGRAFGEPAGALEDYAILVRFDADAVPHTSAGTPPDLARVRLV